MAVTEALMQLFVKDMVSLDRLTSTVKRFASLDETGKEDPSDQVNRINSLKFNFRLKNEVSIFNFIII